jgi:type I restriction enzyme R subunit
MTPEQQAREKIDTQLVASGWAVQDYTKIDFSAGRGIALREVPLKSGTCDYLLLVDRKPIGVVEAKKEGTLLSGVAEQPQACQRPSPKHPAKSVHRGTHMTLCCHVSSGLATARQARLRQSILQKAFTGELPSKQSLVNRAALEVS